MSSVGVIDVVSLARREVTADRENSGFFCAGEDAGAGSVSEFSSCCCDGFNSDELMDDDDGCDRCGRSYPRDPFSNGLICRIDGG